MDGMQTERNEALIRALRDRADPERAIQEKRYHKSTWVHWGVFAPKMDEAIREALDGAETSTQLALARELWREDVWDLKIAAGRLLSRKAIPADAKLWRFVVERMNDLDGWAIADTLANVGSRCLIADPYRLDLVETWVSSPHLWTRRASLVFTLPWTKGQGRDPERMLGWAARLRDDREWFIQKAIGWWLRELSKRDPERVRAFLAEHGAALKGVALREARKYLRAQQLDA